MTQYVLPISVYMFWINFREAFVISKPRKWIFLLLPFLLGISIGIWKWWPSLGYWRLLSISVILFILYFTFPANLLLHGLEILYFDVKKIRSKDMLLPPKLGILTWIWITTLPFMLFFIIPNPVSYISITLFLLAVLINTIPFFNIKKIIFLDSFMLGAIYALPLILGYFIVDVGKGSRFAILGWYAWMIAINTMVYLDKRWPLYDMFGRKGVFWYGVFLSILGSLLLFVDISYISIIGWCLLILYMLYYKFF